LDFLAFQCSTAEFDLDWQKNSKTNVEKAFFLIFISSYAKMSFWDPKKRKRHLIGSKTFFCQWVAMVIKKFGNVMLNSKLGNLPLYR
jgi:hypothetical protein